MVPQVGSCKLRARMKQTGPYAGEEAVECMGAARAVRAALEVRSRRGHPGWIWRRSCCTRAVVCGSKRVIFS